MRRRHAGEVAALLRKREPDRGKPLVMSDALSSGNAERRPFAVSLSSPWRRKFSS
jgi:hypothetical protein